MKILIGLVLLVALAALVMLYGFPGKVVALTQSVAASSAGFEKKSITIDGYDVSYYEGGQGDPVVLLHGMADEKNTFVVAAGALTGKHRVILPDLQGHGENARDPSRDYSIRSHADFLDKFVEKLGLDSFSLGGNSMGGHVSEAYTLEHPEKVKKLILVNAPGLDLDEHVVYGGFGEKMQTREDFNAVMDRVVYTRPFMPGPVVDHMIKETNKNFDFINGLAVAVKAGEDFDLKDRISEIKAPTLIIWGKHDKVVPFNVAEAYDEMIADSKMVVLENASHSPQIDQPAEVGNAMAAFLDQ